MRRATHNLKGPGAIVAGLAVVVGLAVGAIVSDGSAGATTGATSITVTSASTTPTTTPTADSTTAKHFDGTSSVGVLFGAGSTSPGCTASVVDSPKGDIVITAAHCISGTAAGMTFAPGYIDGKEPYGRWTVTSAYGASRWIATGDTSDDFAFLTVADNTINGQQASLQSVVGGSTLGSAPAAGTAVTVPAYGQGAYTSPITCTNKVVYDGAFPEFNCTPYEDGSSGSPWLEQTATGSVLVGIISGLHQGGCYAYTSYSAPFGATTKATYQAAVDGASASTFPSAGGDGCTTGM
jgi:Trypsin